MYVGELHDIRWNGKRESRDPIRQHKTVAWEFSSSVLLPRMVTIHRIPKPHHFSSNPLLWWPYTRPAGWLHNCPTNVLYGVLDDSVGLIPWKTGTWEKLPRFVGIAGVILTFLPGPFFSRTFGFLKHSKKKHFIFSDDWCICQICTFFVGVSTKHDKAVCVTDNCLWLRSQKQQNIGNCTPIEA